MSSSKNPAAAAVENPDEERGKADESSSGREGGTTGGRAGASSPSAAAAAPPAGSSGSDAGDARRQEQQQQSPPPPPPPDPTSSSGGDETAATATAATTSGSTTGAGAGGRDPASAAGGGGSASIGPEGGGRGSSTAGTAATTTSGSMNWDPVRKRLTESDLAEALQAATELRDDMYSIVHTTEFPLMLSALLPAFSSALSSHRTRPNPDPTSVEHRLRHALLDILSKMPTNEVLRPHAPYLVALAMDILNRDYEENALLASRIVFNLYKVYRTLPQDYLQPFLDFVIGAYRALPTAVSKNFSPSSLVPITPQIPTPPASSPPISSSAPAAEATTTTGTEKAPDAAPSSSSSLSLGAKGGDGDTIEQQDAATKRESDKSESGEAVAASAADSSRQSSQPSRPVPAAGVAPPSSSRLLSLALRSNLSFRVLTESPLIVMLMLQLYPSFLKSNVPTLISVMVQALALRAPSFQSIVSASGGAALPPAAAAATTAPGSSSSGQKPPSPPLINKRLYYSRARELVAAQAKTLSFVTYFLRSHSKELKPYEDRLATNVVALLTICPRESVSTRKELLVAMRHLLDSNDFRKGFFRHVDTLLDERVLMGAHHRFSDQASLRPLGYTALAYFVQHVRTRLTMTQMSRVVETLSRVLHDSSESTTLPMSTQYTAVRTLLSIVDVIYHNKDPNPQIGRDLLMQMLSTLVEKLAALVDYFPTVLREARRRETDVLPTGELEEAERKTDVVRHGNRAETIFSTPPDTVSDLQIMIRAIIVGLKSTIYYVNNYRTQREKDKGKHQKIPGVNEEVSSALSRLTHTEAAIIDKYILTALPAAKLLKEQSPSSELLAGPGRLHSPEKPLSEQHREALTYFAAAFTVFDGANLARTLGKRLDLLVDTIVDDPMVMIVPRHILSANPTASFEFCRLLLEYLVERMDELAFPRSHSVVFFDPPSERDVDVKAAVLKKFEAASQRPADSDERKRQRSAVILQLFERVLKSLTAFPLNESIVRNRLLVIVVTCLRSSMEETDAWPDNYCMLLRYVFRSISAGKFEDSYKELLPLIPTVLNGLYRVIYTSQDMVLRHTAVELCLTIPARLSSLLPHMNLLLRVIIPALESSSGDLVNLG